MKTKCTLLALLFIFSASVFGQLPDRSQNRFQQRKSFEKRFDKKDANEHRASVLHRLKPTHWLQQKAPTASYELEFVLAEEDWRDMYIYDAQGNTTEIIEQDWDDIESDWVNAWREVWSYDEDGWPTQCLEYIWDEEGETWLNHWKTEVERDGYTMTLYFYFLDPSGGTWVPTYKEEVAFDIDLNILSQHYYEWDGMGDWIPEWKDEYTYDADGRLLLYEEFYWTGSDWFPEWKDEYTYDGNELTVLSYWYEMPGEWILEWKTEAILDDYGDIAEAIEYYWYEEEEIWEPEWMSVFYFDYSYSIDDLIVPRYYDYQHMITQVDFLYWDWEEEQFMEAFTILLLYKDLGTGMAETGEEAITLYPNPASSHINIVFKNGQANHQFRLYDVNGREVLQKHLTTDERLQLDKLPAGLYFYTIFDQNKKTSGKLLVR